MRTRLARNGMMSGRGMRKGELSGAVSIPSCGGSRAFQRRGGNPPDTAFPRETGKGDWSFLSLEFIDAVGNGQHDLAKPINVLLFFADVLGDGLARAGILPLCQRSFGGACLFLGNSGSEHFCKTRSFERQSRGSPSPHRNAGAAFPVGAARARPSRRALAPAR
jgi:hypothetical protein